MIVAWSVLLFAAAAIAAVPNAIVYPPDQALLEEVSLEILGYLGDPAGGKEVRVTNRSGGTVHSVNAKGFFSVSVSLVTGENVVEFAGEKHTVFVTGGDDEPKPGVFSPPDLHAVDNGCEDCHTADANSLKLNEPVPALCGGCHDDVLKGADQKEHAVVHPPADDKECLSCHDFHGLSISQLPPVQRRALCFECHDDFLGETSNLPHTPVAKGDCTGCHGPHGAPQVKLLRARGLALCMLCHENPALDKAGEEWEVPHPALDDGCGSCHLPHAGSGTGHLNQPQAALCLECHDGFPGALDDADGKLTRHQPVAKGECHGCHNPHGAPNEKLLRGVEKELCTVCHKDPTQNEEGEDWDNAHPALDDGCASCHTHHAGRFPGLLLKPQAPLCFECHDDFLAPPEDGSARRVHLPAAQGKCASCHAPHGSAEAKLLAVPASRELCLRCHADPALSAPGKPWPVEHPALDEGCPTCHTAHVSTLPKLLPQGQKALCGGCHSDKSLDEDDEPWPVPHSPVSSGFCSVCHGAHGGAAEALLLQESVQLCGGCHPEPHTRHLRADIDPKTGVLISETATLPDGFPVRKAEGTLVCIGCHQPHGSRNEKLWNLTGVEFCSQCHTKY